MTVDAVETGKERIAAAFAANGRSAALMPYMMGGFPTPAHSAQIAQAYIDGGADLIEFGLPFSDPLADGPVIHEAATQALAAGTVIEQLLGEIAPIAAQVPVMVMTYYNLIEVRGVARFLDRIAALGVSGLIVPDLPFDEADALLVECDERGVALIQLVAPTTTDERLKAICTRARGFIYTVAYVGTTGSGQADGDELAALVTRVKAHTDLPVAVGFGISSPADAAAVAKIADGAIVGTRLVRAADDAHSAGNDPAAAVQQLVADFAAAL